MNKELETHLKEQLEQINYWLAFAEAKNAAIIAFNVVLLDIYFNVYERYRLTITCMIFLCILSTVISLLSFMPNLTSWFGDRNCENRNMENRDEENRDGENRDGEDRNEENRDGENQGVKNLLFFGDISKFQNKEQFIEESRKKYFKDLQSDDITEKSKDLANQILINSGTTLRKYKYFQISLILDLSSIVVPVLVYVSHLLTIFL